MPASTDTFCPSSRPQWRAWLETHHASSPGIWLIYHRKHSGMPTVTMAEATEEALCFGWINGHTQPLDEHRYRQFYCRRKPRSVWSKINKDSAARLLAAGLMQPAGLAAIERAQRNGAWTMLDDAEALRLPADLAAALQQHPPAASYFGALSRTDRRNLLQWLVLARRPETRQRRLLEIATLAAQQRKPAQFTARKKAAWF